VPGAVAGTGAAGAGRAVPGNEVLMKAAARLDQQLRLQQLLPRRGQLRLHRLPGLPLLLERLARRCQLDLALHQLQPALCELVLAGAGARAACQQDGEHAGAPRQQDGERAGAARYCSPAGSPELIR